MAPWEPIARRGTKLIEKPLVLPASPLESHDRLGRNLEIYRLRDAGLTLKDIGDLFGVSGAQVASILKKKVQIQRRHAAQASLAKVLDGRPRSVLWTDRHEWTPEQQEIEIRRERKEILSKAEQLPEARMKLG